MSWFNELLVVSRSWMVTRKVLIARLAPNAEFDWGKSTHKPRFTLSDLVIVILAQTAEYSLYDVALPSGKVLQVECHVLCQM